eukprot:5058811-Pleurochrysis_carterae.AAC.1
MQLLAKAAFSQLRRLRGRRRSVETRRDPRAPTHCAARAMSRLPLLCVLSASRHTRFAELRLTW